MSLRTPLVYLTISGSCLVIHNVVMILADSLGSPLWLAVLLSFGFVVTIGYLLHSRFTFRQPTAIRAFLRYAFAMSANIPLSFVTTWFWYHWVDFPMLIAAPLASACMLALNFVFSRWAIASPHRNKVTNP